MINLRNYQPFGKKISMENAPVGFVVVFLALHMFTMPFVVYTTLGDTGPTWLGLDVSWQMTVNYARNEQLSWGKDIIFSYGPLGFLSTRVGWGVSRWVFLLFDLFIITNFFFVFKDFVKKASDKFLACVILVAITLLCNSFYGSDLSWVLLFFTCYWMYKAFLDPRAWYFIVIAILVSLSFYIKLNTALVILVLFTGFLTNLVIFKKIKLIKAGILFGGTILLVVLLGLMLRVSVFNYIAGSIEMIRGYNDIMYLEQDQRQTENNIRILFWLMMILLLSYAGFLLKQKRHAEIFFVLIAMTYVFLLKKQAVVRNDAQHLREFFCYSTLVFISGSLLSLNGKLQRFFLPAMTAIVLLALFFKADERSFSHLVKDRFAHKKHYWEHFKYYKPSFYIKQADKRYLPPSVLSKIGQRSIDVFPWDGEYLIENKLNYTPRPVFQSYIAYTAYLEKKNYDFYLSGGPDFVLYDYDAIDNRYPFNDETWVNLFLAKNYTLVDTFTTNERWRILLQRNPQVSLLHWEKTREQKMDFGQEITVDSATCMKIHVRPNLRGKYRSFRYKPKPLEILFMDPAGEWRSFRTSPELLKSGIMVDRLVYTTPDFVKYMSQKDSLPPVVKLKLQGDPRYYSSKIKVEYFSIRP